MSSAPLGTLACPVVLHVHGHVGAMKMGVELPDLGRLPNLKEDQKDR